MTTGQVKIGEIVFNYCNHEEILPRKTLTSMIDTLKKWSTISPKEPTYAIEKFGVPSLIVRFDGVMENNEFRTYEIQDGCAWIGYAGIANGEFKKIRDELVKNAWPPVKLLLPPADHHMWDDELWLQKVTLKEALETNEALLIRRWTFFELPLEKRLELISRSIKPIFHHDDKNYGIRFGWWERVFWHDGSLPWDKAFVLKPEKNYGSRYVMCWKLDDRSGRSTRTQIEDALKRHGSMLLQPFIRPMKKSIGGSEYNMILRPFFGLDPRNMEWVPMGGLWTARPVPHVRIHGASDAISGPLVIR